MNKLKVISIVLNYTWSIVLILLSIGFITRQITVWPDDPIVVIDYSMAIFCIGLAFLMINKNKIGLVASAILFVLCATYDGYGLLVRNDQRCWPGAVLAVFGFVYMSVKYFEHKQTKINNSV